MNKEAIIQSGILERYALGDVTAEEIDQVHQYLNEFPSLRQELNTIEQVLLAMSKDNEIQPPASVKDQIAASIDSQPLAYSPAFTFWKRIAFGAITVGALCLIGAVNYMIKNKHLDNDYVELQAEYSSLQADCEADKNKREADAKIANIIISKSTQIVALENSKNQVYAYWNPATTESLIHIKSLPPLPNDKVYQLWADIAGEMINVKILDEADIQFIPYLSDATSLNITIEPAGGSEHPTVSNLVLSGKV